MIRAFCAVAVAVMVCAPDLCLSAVKPAASMQPCADLPAARCGKIIVAEDRASLGGRMLRLSVRVLPATRTPRREPVFFFAGGPGEAATRAAERFAATEFRRLNPTRDMVFVDQRGTGDSAPLTCPAPQEAQAYFGSVNGDSASLAACRAELETRADLTRYVTSIAADDIEEVRQRLGYGRIVVWGGSYGTRAAMEYMRRHGDQVAAAVLDGVFPFDARDPLTYAFDAQKSLETVFADCSADPRCAADYPHLRRDFDRLLDSFRAGPRTAAVRPSPGVPPVPVRYSIGDFGYTIRGMLYSGERTARLPLEITRAAATGDVDAFAQAYYDRASALARLIPRGLYHSVMCAEEVPPLSADEIVRWTAGTYLGVYLIDEYRRACAQWPRAAVPSAFHQPLSTSIPTLVFSGGRDPATPGSGATDVVRHLSRSRHVVFPKSGHGVSETPCGSSLIAAFLNDRGLEKLDASCAEDVSTSTPFQRPQAG